MNERLFCPVRRTALDSDGSCGGCGRIHEHAFARRRADSLKVGDELVEGDGCLITVTAVERRDRGMLEVSLRSFGPSRVGPLTVRASRLFSVAVAIPATEAA